MSGRGEWYLMIGLKRARGCLQLDHRNEATRRDHCRITVNSEAWNDGGGI